ncbi:MAG: DUF975 family protein [Lachnospiraceae bacterium]|nr:DUF975 family protein [Lachnospiraceae bacterium]
MWTRTDLKSKGKINFQNNYWMSVVAGLIITFFTASGSGSSGRSASSSVNSAMDKDASGFIGVVVMMIILAVLGAVLISAIIKILVGNSLIVGSQKMFLDNGKGVDTKSYGNLVFVFTNGYWKNVVLTMFLKDLFTALWTLLLIVPGIIKGYEYRMIPYLLAENPEMDYKEAFAKSKEMMDGQKLDAFVLDLSFFGWFLLSGLTLGILGLFYVNPYYYQTCAELYLTLKRNNSSLDSNY